MKIRCGTRGSQLALAQTQMVINALEQSHSSLEVVPHEIKTLGDRKQGTKAASQSDKKDWVYDLELALLNNQIDFAVHSSKDIPHEIEPGTSLLPVLKRGNPYDAFLGKKMGDSHQRLLFSELPHGAKVGTASLRRRAFLLKIRPDLIVVEFRGNVTTRVQKLDDSEELMGAIMASAGLDRVNIPGLKYEAISSDIMLPAINQGILAVQFREDDQKIKKLLEAIVDPQTQASWLAERGVVEVLKGDCKSAIGIFAQCDNNSVTITANVMLPDGSESIVATDTGQSSQSYGLGKKLGERLIDLGAINIIERSRYLPTENS